MNWLLTQSAAREMCPQPQVKKENMFGTRPERDAAESAVPAALRAVGTSRCRSHGLLRHGDGDQHCFIRRRDLLPARHALVPVHSAELGPPSLAAGANWCAAASGGARPIRPRG